MRLDEHQMRLIAVGVSVAVNCQSCLETNLVRARECGASDDEIAQAIWVGRKIRDGAISKMDEFITNSSKPGLNPISSVTVECACKTSEN